MITYPLIFYAISLATLRHMVQNRSVITGQLSLNNPCLRWYLPFDYFRRKKDKFSAHKFPLFASIILHGRKKDSPRRV